MDIEEEVDGNYYFDEKAFSTAKLYKIKIDSNFRIDLTFSGGDLQNLQYEGTICQANGYPFSLGRMQWTVLEDIASLKSLCSLFFYEEITSAIKFKDRDCNHTHKFNVKKFPNVVEEVKLVVDCLYRSSLVNRSNRSFFSRSLKESKLKSRIEMVTNTLRAEETCRTDFYEIIREVQVEKVEGNEAFRLERQMNRLEISVENSNESDKNSVLKDVRISSREELVSRINRNSDTKRSRVIERELTRASTEVRSGGFFEISKEFCEVSTGDEDKWQVESARCSKAEGSGFSYELLARKSLRSQRLTEPANSLKLEKELRIVSRLKNKNHILKYYKPEAKSRLSEKAPSFMSLQSRKKVESLPLEFALKGEGEGSLQWEEPVTEVLMEYHPDTLEDKIYCRDTTQRLREKLCYQVIKAVKNLHESGVVHRDIKPSNFLFDEERQRIKIIDFAESALHVDPCNVAGSSQSSALEREIFDNFNSKFYASTLPYSPVECLLKKASRLDEGINNFAIDSWSVGMLLPEILYARRTVNFCEAYQDDIIRMVKSSRFEVYLSRAPCSGVRMVELIVNCLAERNLVSGQASRMELRKIYHSFKIVRRYVRSLKDQIRATSLATISQLHSSR